VECQAVHGILNPNTLVHAVQWKHYGNELHSRKGAT